MRSSIFYGIIFSVLLILPVSAKNQAVHTLPSARLVGSGELHYMLWHVYDIYLYSQDGIFNFDTPFHLTLQYKRPLEGKKIADRSAEEIRKLGFKDEIKLATWHSQMREIFPDVNDGTTLTGVYYPNQPTQFFFNKEYIGSVADADFGKWFFGIWLMENTSEPKLRRALLDK